MHQNAAYLALNGCTLMVPKGAPRNYTVFYFSPHRKSLLKWVGASRWKVEVLSKEITMKDVDDSAIYYKIDWDSTPDLIWERLTDSEMQELLGRSRGWI